MASGKSDEILLRLLHTFQDAPACWCASVRPNGRAHLAPIWHVVHNERVYLVTRSSSVRAHNIAVNESVCLSLPDPMNALILEGKARPAPQLEATLQPLFLAKYGWNISTDADYELILEVTPVKLMAWGDHGEGRWRFSDGQFTKIR